MHKRWNICLLPDVGPEGRLKLQPNRNLALLQVLSQLVVWC